MAAVLQLSYPYAWALNSDGQAVLAEQRHAQLMALQGPFGWHPHQQGCLRWLPAVSSFSFLSELGVAAAEHWMALHLFSWGWPAAVQAGFPREAPVTHQSGLYTLQRPADPGLSSTLDSERLPGRHF